MGLNASRLYGPVIFACPFHPPDARKRFYAKTFRLYIRLSPWLLPYLNRRQPLLVRYFGLGTPVARLLAYSLPYRLLNVHIISNLLTLVVYHISPALV